MLLSSQANSGRWAAFSKTITTKIGHPPFAGTLSPNLLKANPITSKTAKTKPAPDQKSSEELPSQMGDEVKGYPAPLAPCNGQSIPKCRLIKKTMTLMNNKGS